MISYYYGNKHSKNKIEYSWGKGLRRKKPMVYGGSTGIYNSNDKSYKCTVFIVGTKQNEDSLTRVKDHLDMDKIFEENR